MQTGIRKIISWDGGLKLDGIPALDLWDLIVAVHGNTHQIHTKQDNSFVNKREVHLPPHTIHKRKQFQESSMMWTVLILFPQTSTLVIDTIRFEPPAGQRLATPSKKHGLFCAFVLAPVSFLTFGKVNPRPPQTDIFLGGGVVAPPSPDVVLDIGGRSIVIDIWGGRGSDIFWGGGRGGDQLLAGGGRVQIGW